ncbi:MAG: hypothetical protein ABI467_17475 [Kofleriaceae bacterium]
MRILVAFAVVAGCGSTSSPVAAPPAPVEPTVIATPAPPGGAASATRAASATPAATPAPRVTATAIADAKAKLVAKFGAHDAISRGVDQVAELWRTSDGDLAEFCLAQYAPDAKTRDALFARMEALDEQIRGHDLEIGRAARWNSEVETGPMLAVEELLTTYDPSTHVIDDLFRSKVAFAVLLNFPLTSLADRIREGARYSRREWAEVRLASKFEARVPSELEQATSTAAANAERYIAGYNLWMHHVLGEGGARRFPSGKRLISHWNLRDELKANYADKDGLAKQRTIARLMERIVTQTIPAAVIDNPTVDWDPVTNRVTAAPAAEIEADAPKDRPGPSETREADQRFELVLAHFHAARAIDAYSPVAPTYLDRAFEDAELPEVRVRAMLVEILESPLGARVGKEIEAKLGRPLEPHDLWFPLAAPATAEAELDAVTRKKYPDADAFAKDIPRILRDLGFSPARATYLAAHIQVDPARGAGHALEAERRGDKAHLRTRVEHGMDYKGYNIAVHELGHNIEQTFSLYDIDHTLLQGVPNIAFTEALAFLFQARDRELLGRPRAHGEADRLRVLDAFWDTREIAGSALVEIDVWHWLYAHPNATATQLRDATVETARRVWDQYYAPILGGKGTTLLGIYSHTIASPLYLFNYVLGHLIAFQVEQHLAGKGSSKATFGKEFERVAKLGRISPDLWMEQATGKPVGTASLLEATRRALDQRPAHP